MAMSLVAGAAVAADWRIYSGDDKGVLAVDISSVKHGRNYRTAWFAQVQKTTSDYGYDYVLLRTEVDCEAETSARLGFVAYREDGSVVASNDVKTSHVSHPPHSHGHAGVRALCLDDYFEEGISDIGALLRGWRRDF